MAVKEIFRRMRPVQLYVMLALTALFFVAELVVSHVTHALTLLVDSYHMLCNLIALIGCIATVKYGGGGGEDAAEERVRQSCSKESVSGEELKSAPGGEIVARRCDASAEGVSEGCMGVTRCHGYSKDSVETLPGKQNQSNRLVSERRLRNTFGWARIDVLVLMSGTVFLASLCFSLIVEALQTLCHIGHSDEMHHPIPVLCIGAAGILLNGLCYLLIGGYTFHQGSFLHVTPTGDVVLERAVTQDSVRHNRRQVNSASSKNTENESPGEPVPGNEVANGTTLQSAIVTAPPLTQPSPAAVATSYLRAGVSGTPPLRQGPREMFRDVIGCVLVIVCSITVYFTDAQVAKYADPIISIFSAVILLTLSYPYMKESGLILLQTIPDHINIESLRSRLCEAFGTAVVGVHDLHIWRLTPHRTYATVHVVFAKSKDVSTVMKQVTEFFHEQGISHVTIQPEFHRCDAIPFTNGVYADIAPTTGILEPSLKTERCKSYTITVDNRIGKNGDGPVCFLQCSGKGGSCHKLHCCDDAKVFPLPLPHHHHRETRPRYRRRHSLDEVIEYKENDIPGNTVSSSSPNIIIKQKLPKQEELAPCSRRAVSDDALEKSAGLIDRNPKDEINVKDEASLLEEKTDLPMKEDDDDDDSETELKEKGTKDEVNERIKFDTEEVSRTDSTEESNLQSVKISS